MKNLLPLLLLGVLFAACETDPYQHAATDYIEIKKTPCFGFCPVYTFKVNGKGEATFAGERNVTKMGDWTTTLDPETTNELFGAFQDKDFFAFEEEYTAEVTDLPTTWVTFHSGTERKTIKDYYGAPPDLKELEKLAEEIAEGEDGWTKTDENPGQ